MMGIDSDQGSGSSSGSKGWGKGKGGKKPSFSGDFEKGELINKIKSFQRSSEEQKQAWWAFCDSQEGQKRDPARYGADVLQAFLAMNGIPGVQGTKERKTMLVNKVKGFQ